MTPLRIQAGIVTFNPEETRLRENLAAIVPQVARVAVVDNGSANLARIEALCGLFPGVVLLKNETNLGLAQALNRILGWGAGDGAAGVLLLDQDSVCSADLVARLAPFLSADGVAIVAPFVQDRNVPRRPPSAGESVAVNYCITSGSLCRVSAWQAVGGFDERMFIDYVDFDFCLRVRMAGGVILQVPAAVLLHEIGRQQPHGPFTAYHHSPFRCYHQARDMLYYARKHRHAPRELKVAGRGVFLTGLVLVRKMIIVALFERERFAKVRALWRGMRAG